MFEKKYYKVYALKNKDTGRIYVGQTQNDLDQRIMCHLSSLKHGKHQNKYISKDYNNGHKDFEVIFLGEYERQGHYTPMEKEWMVFFRTYDERYGYNVCDRYFSTRYGNKKTRFFNDYLSNH